MSFILDALKKSESERHRHSGPVLMDVRIAPPRRRLPAWAWIIVAVLVVNLLVLAWLLWFAPERRSPQVVAPAAAAVPAATPAAAPPVGAPPAAVQAVPLPAPATPLPDPSLPAAAPAIAAPPAAVAPAATPQPAPVINIAALPRYQDLASAGVALPALRLNLHVHDPVPGNRFVLLNGTRVREGETLPDGLKVLQIVPSGVALEWRGTQFFLNAGG